MQVLLTFVEDSKLFDLFFRFAKIKLKTREKFFF